MKPEIRFKRFIEDWEQRKLREICEYHSSSLTAKDIDKDGNIDLYDANSLIGKTKKGHMETDYITIIKDGAVGRTRLLPKKSMFLGTMGALTPRNSDLYFLYQLVTNADLGKTYTGSIIPHIYFKDYGENRYCIPSCDEQREIGEFLKTLDNLITLHQRKYDKLIEVKKAMLQKMFPKDGSNVPEIRFKGFTEPWEDRKVRDVANRYDNLRIPVAANLRVAGTTPYYGANGIQDYVEGYTHEGEFVLIAEDGANDLKDYPVKCVNGRIWVNNHAHVLQGITKIADNQFLSYSINQADIESLLVGGSRAKLNAETLMDIELILPSLPEQQALGQYFSNLDNLITLQQQKLEKLKNIKKACLGKMFV